MTVYPIFSDEDRDLRALLWNADRDGYARRNLPRNGGPQTYAFAHREVMGPPAAAGRSVGLLLRHGAPSSTALP
jgi:hypothetical protein